MAPGNLATFEWLEKNKVYQRLAYKYEQSGWIQRLSPGVYKKIGNNVEWQGGLYAIQKQLNLPVHVGAKTALELKGLSHFISANFTPYVHLFGEKDQKMRPCSLYQPWKSKILYKRTHLFNDTNLNLGLTIYSYPYFDIKISTPERAIFELLYLCSKGARYRRSSINYGRTF